VGNGHLLEVQEFEPVVLGFSAKLHGTMMLNAHLLARVQAGVD
jgi:hypothetical protein